MFFLPLFDTVAVPGGGFQPAWALQSNQFIQDWGFDMKKNVASQFVGCQLISKSDGSAVTTGTTTIYITGDGGTQTVGSVGAGACTHEGNGYWTYAPAQAETNYDQIGFTFTHTSACNVTLPIYTTFPQTGDSYGLANGANGFVAIKADTADILVDTANMQPKLGTPAGASIAADLLTIGGFVDGIETTLGVAGAGLTALASQASVNTIDDFLDTEIAAIKADTAAILLDTGTDGVQIAPVDKQSTENGQAQGGNANSITLRAAASAEDNLWIGQKISIYSGTGGGQTRGIANYNGSTKVVTVARNWTVNPDATSMYRVELDFGPKVNNSLEVTASAVTGAVGSVTGLTAATVHADLDDIQARLPATLVGGRMNSDVGAMSDGVLTNAAIYADAISSAKITASANAAIAAAVWNDATTGYGSPGTFGKLQTDMSVAVSVVDDFLDTEIAAIKTKTDLIPAAPAATSDIPSAATIATAVFTTQLTESYRADASAPTLAQGICEMLAHEGEVAIAGTTKTIKKFDGTTTAETFTLDSATTPTSITRAT